MTSSLKVKLTGELLQLFGISCPFVQRGPLAATRSARERGDLPGSACQHRERPRGLGQHLKLDLESGTGRTATSAAVTLACLVDPRIFICTIK